MCTFSIDHGSKWWRRANDGYADVHLKAMFSTLRKINIRQKKKNLMEKVFQSLDKINNDD